jgi:hypothetical protein
VGRIGDLCCGGGDVVDSRSAYRAKNYLAAD